MNWISINSEEQLQDVLSKESVVAVFKHSTRCSISSMVKNRLERDWSSDQPVYFLDLIAHRNISNWISQMSGIRHESPQMIVFKDGKAIFDASHTSINATEIIDLF